MNITFTGPQCSGKTTLLKQMKQTSGIMDQFFYIEEVTRLVKREFNVGINEEGANDITQLLIINKELENLFKFKKELLWSSCEGIIHDRCLLDGFLYTKYFYDKKLVSKEVCEQAYWYWNKFYKKYDIFLYPDPSDVKLVDDGERSINNNFRNDMIEYFEQYITEYPIKDKVFRLKGTVEERMEQIKIIVNEHTARQQ